MKISEIASFEVSHDSLAWPWVAIDPRNRRFAFIEGKRIATRMLDNGDIANGPTFELAFPLGKLRGFAVHPDGDRVAYCVSEENLVVLVGADGERARVTLPEGASPCGITFARGGVHIWISAERENETEILLLDASSLAVVGTSRTPALPRPSTHELYVHPVDDAVLLVAACGEEGTFTRVVGWSGQAVEHVETALDGGGVPAGFVGFSTDAARVHLVEADELRTHAWPTLTELSSVQLEDDFVSSFSGAVMGEHIFVDGQSADDGEDLVMRFDRSAIRGVVVHPPFPNGMWAGRLGADLLVTVEPKGDPAASHVVRVTLPTQSN